MSEITLLQKKIKIKNILCLAIAVVAVCCLPSSRNEFLLWDDLFALSENPLFRPLTWHTYWQLLSTQTSGVLYNPVIFTYWSAVVAVFQMIDGENWVNGYGIIVLKILNIVIHVFNIFLVRRLLITVFRLERDSTALLFSVLLFAVHPIHAQSLFWIMGAKDLWLIFFGLCYLIKIAEGRPKTAVLYFLAALFTKQVAVTLPVLAAVIMWQQSSFKKSWKKFLYSHLLAALPAIWMLKVAIQGQKVEFLPAGNAQISKLYVFSDTLGFYFQKLLLPFNLSADYGRTSSWVAQNSPVMASAVFLVFAAILIFACVKAIVRHSSGFKVLALSLLLILIPLIPVSGLVPFTSQVFSNVSDRYASFSVIGLAFLYFFITDHFKKRAVYAAMGAFLLVMFWQSLLAKDYWADNLTLFQQTLNGNPASLMAHTNLAVLDSQKGDYQSAIRHLESAIAADGNYMIAKINLAKVFSKMNQNEKARSIFESVLSHELMKDNLLANFEYATFLEKNNEGEQALHYYKACARIAPADARAFFRMGSIYLAQNNFAESFENIKIATDLRPDNPGYRAALETVKKLIGQ